MATAAPHRSRDESRTNKFGAGLVECFINCLAALLFSLLSFFLSPSRARQAVRLVGLLVCALDLFIIMYPLILFSLSPASFFFVAQIQTPLFPRTLFLTSGICDFTQAIRKTISLCLSQKSSDFRSDFVPTLQKNKGRNADRVSLGSVCLPPAATDSMTKSSSQIPRQRFWKHRSPLKYVVHKLFIS